ncbi:helix-turn-helix transcriptional regulator [Mycoplasmatota bacterium]|nr:helix-turn-helix transcriptional regulator [Mycoplasmatota bacterium]
MIDLKVIGQVITIHRERNLMTQLDLADRLYVTRQAVSKWETGKSIPSIEMMVELTKIFNITIDDLLYGQKSVKDDFSYLLNCYPREYVINQLIQGNLEVKIEKVLYLLSPEERMVVITHIIKNTIKVDLVSILPYLTLDERMRIISAFKDQFKRNLYFVLSFNEKKFLEGKNESKKNVTIFR